ncbi:MAG: 16S rRNA (guanine(527)-N(7))-methyltransferase RsmG [Candidatus Krumholzibacteria bacterium]|nr:16S rRNA (guanine(527)-N(7))-methyltransferase RsmG [Candidatus Krumholzibacteria bacterium]
MNNGEMGRIAEDTLRRAGFESEAPETVYQLSLYLQEVDFWNARMHLVGKGRFGTSLELLVFDSLALLNAADESGIAALRVADIGSGAGFPGLVWKIVRSKLELTLFERRLKPQLFLERVVALLGLKGITVFGGDAANFKETGEFDLVVSKAAGRLAGILPLADKLLGPGGAYITVKGRSWESEMPQNVQSRMRLESAVELPEKRGTALVFRKNLPG